MRWKDTIYNHEAAPPPGLWDKIAQDLDNDFVVFRNRLYDVEVAPPENSWEQITSKTAVFSENKPKIFRIRKEFRIAVAAAITGILFMTINYFITGNGDKVTGNRNTTGRQQASEEAHRQPAENSPATGSTNKNIESERGRGTKSSLIAANSTGNAAKKESLQDLSNPFYSERLTVEAPQAAYVPTEGMKFTDRYDLGNRSSKKIRNLNGEIREDIRLIDLPNSYFFMTGPNGQSIRVSSKFRNTIQYLNGSQKEEMLDVILRESRYWRNQFKLWKEEVGQAEFVPTINNFMDISELMKLLQQHNRQ